MSWQEKAVIAVLFVTLVLWMTEKMHGVSSALVALAAAGILVGLNIITRPAFRNEIAWEAIVFVGCILNISEVFKSTGIDKWIGRAIGPYLVPLLSESIFLFIIALSIAMYLIRFLMASQMAAMIVFMILLLPLVGAAGINPWVVAFASFVSVNVWLFMYQNVQYLIAFFAADSGQMVSHKQMIKLCFAYMIISIIGLLVSIPVWRLTGLLK